MLRRYWLAIWRVEDLKDIPQAVKVLGEDGTVDKCSGKTGIGVLGLAKEYTLMLEGHMVRFHVLVEIEVLTRSLFA